MYSQHGACNPCRLLLVQVGVIHKQPADAWSTFTGFLLSARNEMMRSEEHTSNSSHSGESRMPSSA